MDVQAVLDAHDIIQQWEMNKSHIAPWTWQEVYDIVQTSHFINWYRNNPQGTIDQYYLYLSQKRAYENSPQDRIECLENQMGDMRNEIGLLRKDIGELQLEIAEQERQASHVNKVTSGFIIIAVMLLLGLVIFYFKNKKNE